MPRRKQQKVFSKELKIHDELVAELQKNQQFRNCDFSTLEIIGLSKKPPPRMLGKIVDKVIRNLQRLIAIGGKDKIMNKKGLCKAMGISRPTFDKWCENGFIATDHASELGCDPGPFEPEVILNQLLGYRSKP